MLKFKIEQKEYQIPEIMNIEHYVSIYKIKDIFSDDYYAARLVNIITGAPVKDLLESDFQEVNYIANYILSLLPIDKPKFVDRFTLDGIEYGFFPNWKDLTFAEFVDLDTISTKKADEILDNLHLLAAIMYRPIISEEKKNDYKIEKYDVKTMIERGELFKKKLDVRYVLAAQNFFIRFAERYLNYSQLSSIPKLTTWSKIKILWGMRKMIFKIAFKKPLDGTWSSTELLRMILQNTNMSIKKP